MRKKILETIKNSKETEIDLQSLAITDDEINEIINEIIKMRPNANMIYLNNNQISDRGAILLGEKLAQLNALSFLDLQFNAINSRGAEGIFRLKLEHPALRIALHGNMISDVSEMNKIEEKYNASK